MTSISSTRLIGKQTRSLLSTSISTPSKAKSFLSSASHSTSTISSTRNFSTPTPSSSSSSSTPSSIPPINPDFLDDSRYILGTYARQPFQFVSGSGSTLYDSNGKSYIDFYSGIAVNALGHSDPDWLAALHKQSTQLAHISNLFYSKPQVELAKKLLSTGEAKFDKVFYCNSGTEANEAALKFARKYQYMKYLNQIEQLRSTTTATTAEPSFWQRLTGSSSSSSSCSSSSLPPPHTKTNIVAFNGGFHGRTIGSLSMTYKSAYKTPFYPLMNGVSFVDLNDSETAKRVIDKNTCAVIIEPVQGEGGVNACKKEFLQLLRAKCSEVDAVLICDEVQVGLGRLGSFYAHTQFDIEPDLVTLAKPLAGGLPIGAVLVKQSIANAMKPGDHGTTFAGGPLVTATALAVVNKISNPIFLDSVQMKGKLLVNLLRELRVRLEKEKKEGSVVVREIRALGYDYSSDSGEGKGLLVGFELNVAVSKIITKAAEQGIVLIGAGENTLRLVPPLVITEEEIKKAVKVIEGIVTTHTVEQLK